MQRLIVALGFAMTSFWWTPVRGAGEGPWEDYRFLLGNWAGEGKGAPGQGKGRFSFATDLQGKILVRKHRAEVAAAGGRPSLIHDDLMIIYPQAGKGAMHAIYFDSEGHVIDYSATFSPDKKSLTFVSTPRPGMPRFRLSYVKQDEGSLAIKFEMAPLGKPDAFKTYTEGTAVRE
jgi:hypothetical protein